MEVEEMNQILLFSVTNTCKKAYIQGLGFEPESNRMTSDFLVQLETAEEMYKFVQLYYRNESSRPDSKWAS